VTPQNTNKAWSLFHNCRVSSSQTIGMTNGAALLEKYFPGGGIASL
jgi:hypothetical protein